ncbi:MAG: HAMP domain-containing sensor histidine kinase [Proteobacteria bacterium]|nr:HAMP domain-containing sensor histidine kinase [Pseudomonadota bacterium]
MRILRTLYARLAASLLMLVIVLGTALLWTGHYVSDMYSQEVTQRLNQSIAMYVTNEQQLIEGGKVNQQAVELLAQRVMTINPSVEVYLLDAQGNILGHLLAKESVRQRRVSLGPVSDFLSGSATFPLMGDDPRNPGARKVFSASPIVEQGETVGYLYAVLGGARYQTLRESVQNSYILRVGLATILGALVLAMLAGFAVFFMLTRRLTLLRQEVERFQMDSPDETIIAPVANSVAGDEVDALRLAFAAMAKQIQQQFRALQSVDSTRRELIANVSHDLRTPLASMQGYIETLMIKDEELTTDTRRHYLEVAHKHTQRMNDLIEELFELAKLDAGPIELNTETFSLMELIHDSVQDFELTARDKHIDLTIETGNDNCYVVADIALIQRVLQNLLSNALRHTPPGRTVTISVSDNEHRARIEVSDTGNGIASHEIPHIFERFYQSQQQRPSEELGAGLGLAIVKKILDLHQSTIRVDSRPDQGTRFIFELPMPA